MSSLIASRLYRHSIHKHGQSCSSETAAPSIAEVHLLPHRPAVCLQPSKFHGPLVYSQKKQTNSTLPWHTQVYHYHSSTCHTWKTYRGRSRGLGAKNQGFLLGSAVAVMSWNWMLDSFHEIPLTAAFISIATCRRLEEACKVMAETLFCRT
jgi:hypothetical protein